MASDRPSPLALSLVLLLIASPALALVGFDPSGGGSGYPDTANGKKAALPAVTALPIGDEVIEVDGRLDDPVWQRADAATATHVEQCQRDDAGSFVRIRCVTMHVSGRILTGADHQDIDW